MLRVGRGAVRPKIPQPKTIKLQALPGKRGFFYNRRGNPGQAPPILDSCFFSQLVPVFGSRPMEKIGVYA
jgi:hypothetical protein